MTIVYYLPSDLRRASHFRRVHREGCGNNPAFLPHYAPSELVHFSARRIPCQQNSTLRYPIPYMGRWWSALCRHAKRQHRAQGRISEGSILLHSGCRRRPWLCLAWYVLQYTVPPPVTMPHEKGGICRRKRRESSPSFKDQTYLDVFWIPSPVNFLSENPCSINVTP
jgi:hypothetical protein